MAGLNLKSKFNDFLNMSQLPHRVSASFLGLNKFIPCNICLSNEREGRREEKKGKNVLYWQKKRKPISLQMRKEAPVSQGEETQPHALMGISKCSDCVAGLLDKD